MSGENVADRQAHLVTARLDAARSRAGGDVAVLLESAIVDVTGDVPALEVPVRAADGRLLLRVNPDFLAGASDCVLDQVLTHEAAIVAARSDRTPVVLDSTVRRVARPAQRVVGLGLGPGL